MQTQVLVIGGGATGTAIARDLALRGVHSILVEMEDINAGASGGNHGLLHSGGRYVSNDQEAARECREEGLILKKLAPQCIEDTGGLFVAVEGDDENYIEDFPKFCEQCGIPCERITVEEARTLEPTLSNKIIAAYKTEDASVDPFKLSLENICHAMKLGSGLMRKTKVVGFDIENSKIVRARCKNLQTGEDVVIEPEHVVNAAGAWAGEVAALAGSTIEITYSKGTLLITNSRISHRIINRLRRPSDADILVPGGTVSIIGTTSVTIEDLNNIRPSIEEADLIVKEGAMMVPMLDDMRYIRAYSGVRPLFGSSGSSDGRSVSRGFALLDHEEDNLTNFMTITGGKLTTFRLMAEKVTDAVCGRMGVSAPCTTHTEPLPKAVNCDWTEPGLSPKEWLKGHLNDDTLLCECEMVTKKAIDVIIDSIIENKEIPTITDIGVRSRVGKGACQGTYCSARIASHMYDRGVLAGKGGVDIVTEFINERWKGVHSILWGEQEVQAELMEAIHCGLYGMELEKTE